MPEAYQHYYNSLSLPHCACCPQRNRTNMFVYNFRAEKLPKKYPTLKPKSNRFNMGILEIALQDEYIGETFGDERMAKVAIYLSL